MSSRRVATLLVAVILTATLFVARNAHVLRGQATDTLTCYTCDQSDFYDSIECESVFQIAEVGQTCEDYLLYSSCPSDCNECGMGAYDATCYQCNSAGKVHGDIVQASNPASIESCTFAGLQDDNCDECEDADNNIYYGDTCDMYCPVPEHDQGVIFEGGTCVVVDQWVWNDPEVCNDYSYGNDYQDFNDFEYSTQQECLASQEYKCLSVFKALNVDCLYRPPTSDSDAIWVVESLPGVTFGNEFQCCFAYPGAPTSDGGVCCSQGTICNDGDLCTQDACPRGQSSCQHVPIPGCGGGNDSSSNSDASEIPEPCNQHYECASGCCNPSTYQCQNIMCPPGQMQIGCGCFDAASTSSAVSTSVLSSDTSSIVTSSQTTSSQGQSYCCMTDFCSPIGNCEEPYATLGSCLAECGVASSSTMSTSTSIPIVSTSSSSASSLCMTTLEDACEAVGGAWAPGNICVTPGGGSMDAFDFCIDNGGTLSGNGNSTCMYVENGTYKLHQGISCASQAGRDACAAASPVGECTYPFQLLQCQLGATGGTAIPCKESSSESSSSSVDSCIAERKDACIAVGGVWEDPVSTNSKGTCHFLDGLGGANEVNLCVAFGGNVFTNSIVTTPYCGYVEEIDCYETPELCTADALYCNEGPLVGKKCVADAEADSCGGPAGLSCAHVAQHACEQNGGKCVFAQEDLQVDTAHVCPDCGGIGSMPLSGCVYSPSISECKFFNNACNASSSSSVAHSSQASLPQCGGNLKLCTGGWKNGRECGNDVSPEECESNGGTCVLGPGFVGSSLDGICDGTAMGFAACHAAKGNCQFGTNPKAVCIGASASPGPDFFKECIVGGGSIQGVVPSCRVYEPDCEEKPQCQTVLKCKGGFYSGTDCTSPIDEKCFAAGGTCAEMVQPIGYQSHDKEAAGCMLGNFESCHARGGNCIPSQIDDSGLSCVSGPQWNSALSVLENIKLCIEGGGYVSGAEKWSCIEITSNVCTASSSTSSQHTSSSSASAVGQGECTKVCSTPSGATAYCNTPAEQSACAAINGICQSTTILGECDLSKPLPLACGHAGPMFYCNINIDGTKKCSKYGLCASSAASIASSVSSWQDCPEDYQCTIQHFGSCIPNPFNCQFTQPHPDSSVTCGFGGAACTGQCRTCVTAVSSSSSTTSIALSSSQTSSQNWKECPNGLSCTVTNAVPGVSCHAVSPPCFPNEQYQQDPTSPYGYETCGSDPSDCFGLCFSCPPGLADSGILKSAATDSKEEERVALVILYGASAIVLTSLGVVTLSTRRKRLNITP